MRCQAPERLDENGNVKQEYIDFMKQIPSPEERAKMTDDDILDWFISRRGGDKEIIKEKVDRGEFEEWMIYVAEHNSTLSFTGVENILNQFRLGDIQMFEWTIIRHTHYGITQSDWDKLNDPRWFSAFNGILNSYVVGGRNDRGWMTPPFD